MAHQDSSVSISNLHFDASNPRHDPIRDEATIISTLVDDEQVLALMEDIAAQNGTSPIERMAVVRIEATPEHYTVVEGNRRLCALKLLSDPQLAPTSIAKRKAREAAKILEQPINEIAVCIFDTIGDAQPWITRRHMGEQNGVGTKKWGTAGQARNLLRQDASSGAEATHQNVLAHAILDRLTQLGTLDAETRREVSVTTLSRYLSTPTVREALGLASNSELIYACDDGEVDIALHKFVMNSLPDGGEEPILSSRSDGSDRRAYALKFAEEGSRPFTPKTTPAAPSPEIHFDEESATPENTDLTSEFLGAAAGAVASKGTRSTKSPAARRFLMPTSFVVKSDDLMLGRLPKEMRALDVEKYPYSANYLLRAFLERTMFLFIKKQGENPSGMPDHLLTLKAKDYCKSLGADRSVHEVLNRAGSSNSCVYSLAAIGGAIHGAHVPSKSEALGNFDTWKAALTFMLENTQ